MREPCYPDLGDYPPNVLPCPDIYPPNDPGIEIIDPPAFPERERIRRLPGYPPRRPSSPPVKYY